MPDAHDRLPSRRDRHAPTRALASLAASLAAVNAAFLLWPNVDLGPGLPAVAPAREALVMEMIEPTVQPPPPAYIPPAPPPPPTASEQPPVEVPDRVIVDEIVRDVEIPALPAPPTRSAPAPAPRVPVAPPGPPAPVPSRPAPSSDRIVEAPDRSPRLRGQALPVYPASERRSGFRGRARVKVLISQGGQVTEAEIVERVEIDRGRESAVGAFEPVFEAAILEAARRHLFSPARDGGERVRAYAFVTIALDPPD